VLVASPEASAGTVFEQIDALVFLFHGFLWVWAAFRVTTRRWRLFFWAVLAGGAVRELLLSERLADARATARAISWGVMPFLLAVAILFVVLRDFRDRNRYPWPHWVGVAVVLWTCLLKTTLMVIRDLLLAWYF
jgi:hypothetical protein